MAKRKTAKQPVRRSPGRGHMSPFIKIGVVFVVVFAMVLLMYAGKLLQ